MPGLTRASMRRFDEKTLAVLSSLKVIMDCRIKPGNDKRDFAARRMLESK
jgi:hypothetical protein